MIGRTICVLGPMAACAGWREGVEADKGNSPLTKSVPERIIQPVSAGMAELADALDSGSSEGFLHAGSSPVSRTTEPLIFQGFCFFLAAFHPNPTPTDQILGWGYTPWDMVG